MYSPISKENSDWDIIEHLEEQVFGHLQLTYSPVHIPIAADESIHALFINSEREQASDEEVFFVSHGFGGSSLLHFATLGPLLSRGHVVLWQIRGMGLSQKKQECQQKTLSEIEEYYLQTILVLLNYFKARSSTMICHSFSAYLALRFLTKFPEVMRQHVKQIVCLSPIGITPREEDYKNFSKGCRDCLYTALIKVGWNLKLSYKQLLKNLGCCLKDKILDDFTGQIELKEREKQLFSSILKTMIALPTGSESLFFSYFDPRVLPKVPLEPIFENPPLQVTLVYGGESDWVDKKGGVRLGKKFPERVEVKFLEKCSHNIPFHTSECVALFEELF